MRDSWEIQRAVYAALSAQVADPVYDEVPERDPDPASHEPIRPPYHVVGETTERPDDTHTDLGTSESILLHQWSAAEGAAEVKGMMAEVDEVLHRAVLSLSDGRRVFLTREMAEVLREEGEGAEDETWRHGVVRYRARTMEGRDV